MRRRQFIAALTAAAAWPLTARAQSARPVIGYLGTTSEANSANQIAGLRQGLAHAGLIEGRDVAIEYRWGDGDYTRLPALAADLVSMGVNAILAGGLPAALAAKTATSSIPIVFVIGADPVEFKLAAGLSRPQGNLTGVSQLYKVVGGKRVELLHELVPLATAFGVFSNPANPNATGHLQEVEQAARSMGLQVQVQLASSPSEIEAGFKSLAVRGIRAVLVADDPFFTLRREQFVSTAAENGLPAIYYAREFVEAGGLISYGSSTSDNYREAGGYLARILGGVSPIQLPILQPTKVELVINLKTAKVLGVTVPASLLARADEVIE
jgi:ABC-type uncharacterized transport system substrate-binding protein